MVLKREEEKVKLMISHTLSALCENTLPYKTHASLEGLIAITLDNEEIILVNLKESFTKTNVMLTPRLKFPVGRCVEKAGSQEVCRREWNVEDNSNILHLSTDYGKYSTDEQEHLNMHVQSSCDSICSSNDLQATNLPSNSRMQSRKRKRSGGNKEMKTNVSYYNEVKNEYKDFVNNEGSGISDSEPEEKANVPDVRLCNVKQEIVNANFEEADINKLVDLMPEDGATISPAEEPDVNNFILATDSNVRHYVLLALGNTSVFYN